MRVGVARIAVVDGTGQRMQLLQWYRISHSQVGGDQIPAGHAGQTTGFKKIEKKGNVPSLREMYSLSNNII